MAPKKQKAAAESATATLEPAAGTAEHDAFELAAKSTKELVVAGRSEVGLPVTEEKIPGWVKIINQLKKGIAKDASPEEWKLFIYKCARIGVDPAAGQAYLIPFNEKEGESASGKKHAMVIGIDGFRSTSKDRLKGDYQGTVGPFWCGEDGKWTDAWVAGTPPRAARVGVRIKDNPEPVWGVALYDEFVVMKWDKGKQIPTKMWLKMPANQLAKCAEAQAHRKATPHVLANVYIMEELEQAKTHPVDLAQRLDAAASVSPTVKAGIEEAQVVEESGEADNVKQFKAELSICKMVEEATDVWKRWSEAAKFLDIPEQAACHALLTECRAKLKAGAA